MTQKTNKDFSQTKNWADKRENEQASIVNPYHDSIGKYRDSAEHPNR